MKSCDEISREMTVPAGKMSNGEDVNFLRLIAPEGLMIFVIVTASIGSWGM